MKTLSFAFRNVRRNKRRSAISVIGIAFAAIIMILWGGLLDGMMASMQDNVTRLELGELQIHPMGYEEDASIFLKLEHSDSLLDELTASGFSATPRLFTFALASSGASSAGVELRGIDPARESKVTNLHTFLEEGTWIDPSDPKGVVIGRTLAKQLSLEAGGEIIVVGQAADGSIANDIFRVRGVLKPVSSQIDRAGLILPIKSFRELVLLEQGVHEIAVRRMKSSSMPLEAARLKIQGLVPDASVKTWRQLQPLIAEMVDNSRVSLVVMFVITYVAVGLLFINSSLMSVFERMRELGILKALGMRPYQIMGLVLAEAFWLVVVASVVAVVIGVPLALLLADVGIDLRDFADTLAIGGISMEPHWYALVTPATVIQPLIFLFVIIVLAVLYPAAKAALINPVEAIHHH